MTLFCARRKTPQKKEKENPKKKIGKKRERKPNKKLGKKEEKNALTHTHTQKRRG